VPDAKKFMDAAVDAPHLCGIDATIGSLSFGTMAAPVARNNFDRPDMGPDMGRLEYFIAARLSMGTTPPIDALIFDVLQPGTAASPTAFQTNTPYSFETDATATGSITADAYLLGDFDGSQTVQNFYWAQSGSVSFTTFETPKKDTGTNTALNKDGSKHFGTVTMVPFKEIDQETGELLAGGCTTTMGGLSFFTQQNADAIARTLPEQEDPVLEQAIARVKEFKAKRAMLKAQELLNQ
jgi:hypothetical protein